MKEKPISTLQKSLLFPSMAEQCDPRQPFKKLTNALNWEQFEDAFAKDLQNQRSPAIIAH